jgi:hypothetical protein
MDPGIDRFLEHWPRHHRYFEVETHARHGNGQPHAPPSPVVYRRQHHWKKEQNGELDIGISEVIRGQDQEGQPKPRHKSHRRMFGHRPHSRLLAGPAPHSGCLQAWPLPSRKEWVPVSPRVTAFTVRRSLSRLCKPGVRSASNTAARQQAHRVRQYTAQLLHRLAYWTCRRSRTRLTHSVTIPWQITGVCCMHLGLAPPTI